MPNLVKQRFIVSDNRQARVINSNDKLEEIYRDMKMKREDLQSPPEFEAGIFAEKVEVSEYESEWQEEQESFEPFEQEEEVVPEFNVEELLEEANMRAQQIISDANEDAERIREQAHQSGFEEGMNQARMQGLEAEEALKVQYEERIQTLEEEYNQKFEQMEAQIVDAFADIIRDVLSVEIHQYSEIISELILRTVQKLDTPKQLSIYVAPDNYMAVRGIEHILTDYIGKGAELEIVRDDKLLENQCKIETERGIYDCGFDTQFNNLMKKLKMLSIRS